MLERFRLCVVLLLASAISCGAFAASPYTTLRRMTKPDYGKIPSALRESYAEAREAQRRGDKDAAYAAFSALAADARLDLDGRTYCLMMKMGVESGTMRHSEAVATLRKIVALRPDSPEVQYQAELGIAYMMSQAATHPGFDPTMAEKEAQFERIFTNYDPYRRETVEAHVEFASECMVASTKDPGMAHYAQVALQHLHDAKSIVDAIADNPSITNDKTRALLPQLSNVVAGQLSIYETQVRAREESQRQPAKAAQERAVESVFQELLDDKVPEEGAAMAATDTRSAGVGTTGSRERADVGAKASERPLASDSQRRAPASRDEEPTSVPEDEGAAAVGEEFQDGAPFPGWVVRSLCALAALALGFAAWRVRGRGIR